MLIILCEQRPDTFTRASPFGWVRGEESYLRPSTAVDGLPPKVGWLGAIARGGALTERTAILSRPNALPGSLLQLGWPLGLMLLRARVVVGLASSAPSSALLQPWSSSSSVSTRRPVVPAQ